MEGGSCVEAPFYMISMYDMHLEYNISRLSSLPARHSVSNDKAKGGCIMKGGSYVEAPFKELSEKFYI